MIFQNPKVLYALFAIAIPIIIHLFNLQKEKKIYFSSIRFLKEIKQRKKQRTKLRNILILLSRILALGFLIIAFAKPFIPTKQKDSTNNIFVYIDNSLSMDVDFGNGNLLEIAKENAKEIIKLYPDYFNFYLITNEFNKKHNVKYNKQDIYLQIDNVNPSYKQKAFKDITQRINQINKNTYHLYFISDLQENTFKFKDSIIKELKNKVTIIPVKNINLSNVNIDSLFIEEPIFKYNNKINLHVQISNSSNYQIINEPLFLYINNKQRSQQYINLLPDEKREIIFDFVDQKNIISGEIRTQDVPITFDNNLFFTINKLDKVNVSIINNKTKKNRFSDLFKNDTSMFLFNEYELQNIKYSLLLRQDLIILNEIEKISSGLSSTLIDFLENGGSLLIVPPNNLIDFKEFNRLLTKLNINNVKTTVSNNLKINNFILDNDIYKNVFTNNNLKKIEFPISKKHYEINKKIPFSEIITLANKDPFLINYNFKKGKIFQFISPLNSKYNNFTEHALFVPTLINIATSSCKLTPSYYILGKTKYIKSKEKLNNIQSIKLVGNNIDLIPTIINKNGNTLIDDQNQIMQPGLYSLFFNNKIGEKVAFNINSSENKITTINSNTISELLKNNNLSILKPDIKLTENIIKNINGKQYWKTALLFSLLFFAIEILFIKTIKL